jgi:hypothetical protein
LASRRPTPATVPGAGSGPLIGNARHAEWSTIPSPRRVASLAAVTRTFHAVRGLSSQKQLAPISPHAPGRSAPALSERLDQVPAITPRAFLAHANACLPENTSPARAVGPQKPPTYPAPRSSHMIKTTIKDNSEYPDDAVTAAAAVIAAAIISEAAAKKDDKQNNYEYQFRDLILYDRDYRFFADRAPLRRRSPGYTQLPPASGGNQSAFEHPLRGRSCWRLSRSGSP